VSEQQKVEPEADEGAANEAAQSDGQMEPGAEHEPQGAGAEPAAGADAAEEPALETGSADGTADTAALQDRIQALEDELAQVRDAQLRAYADAQNAQRRAEQEVDRARKYALERFCGELLPVVDSLERALESASGDDEQLRPIAEGVELTLKNFLNALRKHNIEPVDPQGEPFDPQLHQAMSQVENPDVEPNTVIAVMQKGYTLNGRLVRPAMVMVSKAGGA
jgi:molecular chaperone GrpE